MTFRKLRLDLVSRSARLFCSAPIPNRKRPTHLFSPKRATEEEQRLFAKIQNKADPRKINWASLRAEILKTAQKITERNVDAIIVNACCAEANFDTARSYLKFLKENRYDLNIATAGKYLKLFYHSRDRVTRDDCREILAIYDDLRRKYPVMDATTAESCLHAISITHRWEESFELLDMIKIASSPSGSAYSAVISSSFRNDKPDVGWKYMNELLDVGRLPHQHVYASYLEHCLNNFRGEKSCTGEIEKLLDCWGENDLKPTKETMEKFIGAYEKFRWTGVFTALSSRGVCNNCKHQLFPLKISAEEFSMLSRTILDEVIVGKDLYKKTTPTELKAFLDFVERTKPYDVVVDGLNVAYISGTANTRILAKQLATVVKYFVERNEIVMVLGRRHMMFWPQKEMRYIKDNAQVFLANNLSQDDPCLLYAALASGQNTRFISRDLMRQHKYLLKTPLLKRLFKQWQMSHQYLLRYIGTDEVIFKKPLVYLPVAQGDDRCWHIPYDIEEMAQPPESYEAPQTWVCLRRK